MPGSLPFAFFVTFVFHSFYSTAVHPMQPLPAWAPALRHAGIALGGHLCYAQHRNFSLSQRYKSSRNRFDQKKTSVQAWKAVMILTWLLAGVGHPGDCQHLPASLQPCIHPNSCCQEVSIHPPAGTYVRGVQKDQTQQMIWTPPGGGCKARTGPLHSLGLLRSAIATKTTQTLQKVSTIKSREMQL